MKFNPNDVIATLTGCCLMAGSLMLAFYAGMQATVGHSGEYLTTAGFVMPVGALCVWSGASAILRAVKAGG